MSGFVVTRPDAFSNWYGSEYRVMIGYWFIGGGGILRQPDELYFCMVRLWMWVRHTCVQMSRRDCGCLRDGGILTLLPLRSFYRVSPLLLIRHTGILLSALFRKMIGLEIM